MARRQDSNSADASRHSGAVPSAMGDADTQGVSERAQVLFKHMVERYISDGAPVASKVLATQSGIDVSPATVRNIMADLESRGLVFSPHTSAGKVPTHQGLRFFVDSLISVRQPGEREIAELHKELNPDKQPTELVSQASHLLSHITRMAGVVTLPKREVVSLRQVEFLSLSGNRVLVILVVNEREVQNRVIHTEREYSEAELVAAANFINARFAGESLSSVREGLLASMQDDRERMDKLLNTAMDVAGKALEEPEDKDDELVVSGRSNLVMHSAEAAEEVIEAFSRKGRILHLLDRCLDSDGIQLFIGGESGYRGFQEVSLVTAPYDVDGEVAGVLGVIGPTRMAYQNVIPLVDVTARVLSAALRYE
ncbi:MAG: heat-inducible transcriptional repressor HrcA [Pseudomonadaceae bacterium]|nr:heat-inducible transcriptional repressor HrcA [Pseudomonadaceae bacterium]